jgi:hypothetical protein
VKIPEISLSFQKLAFAQFSATVLAAVIWFAVSFSGGFGFKNALSGVAVSGVLFAVSIATLIIFSPGKKRSVAAITTLWSATSFIRFIAALGGSTLLYYVAQFGLSSLMFSFLLTAVFLLVAETKSLSASLSKVNQQPNE